MASGASFMLRAHGLNWIGVIALGLAVVGSMRGSCVGAEGRLAAAHQALAQGMVDSASGQLSELAQSHPDCVPALLLRAQLLTALGDSRQAEALLVRASELVPSRPGPFFQLGVFYDSRQQHGKAATQFRKVLALTPGDPQAYDYLGLSLEALGDFEKAEASYRMGLARNRGPRFDPMLHYNYGRFLVKHGRFSDAKDHLEEAARLSPGVRAVHYERAKLAEKVGDIHGARGHAEKALQLEDRGGVILDMQVHYLLSRIYRELGETELAEKYTTLSRRAEIPLQARRRSGR